MIALVSPPDDHGAANTDGAAGRSLPGASARGRAVRDATRDGAPDPVRVALEVSRLTVTRMAEELGIPRATLEAYRLGTRRMPAASRARLAAYLAGHAELLRRLARLLHGEDA